MNEQEFKEFFRPYAENVDNANSLAFWKLSDDIITCIIQKHIPAGIAKNQTILDAGGGTGRWICDLSKIYRSKFVLFDLSEDMLAVAAKNISKAGIGSRTSIIRGDLTDMNAVPDESVDYIVSIYSPLSFIYEPDAAARELFRVLKKGGKALVMAHGYFNAIASKINSYRASPSELKKLADKREVKWGSHVPKLLTYSKEDIESLFADVGFTPAVTYGVPVFIQPGSEDWDPSNSKKSAVSAALADKEFYDEVVKLEMKFNADPTVVNRGMNMFAVFQK